MDEILIKTYNLKVVVVIRVCLNNGEDKFYKFCAYTMEHLLAERGGGIGILIKMFQIYELLHVMFQLRHLIAVGQINRTVDCDN